MRVGMFLPLLAVALLMGCGQTQEKKAEVRTEEIGALEFPDSPSRQAYEGFQWQRSFGAGLRFWAQDNGKIRVMTDASLPGACVARLENGQWRLSDPVIRVFRLKGDGLDSLVPELKELSRLAGEDWDESETFDFEEVQSGRKGVKRYLLKLTGASADALRERGSREPIPFTCGGWGIGNSGTRYFELFDSYPGIALFVEIGQDAPLFDEMSIQPFDSVRVAKGELIMGHEAYQFTPEGDSTYWVVDRSGELKKMYEAALPAEAKPYTPVPAELKVNVRGFSSEGFAAEYPGVLEVMEILKVGQ